MSALLPTDPREYDSKHVLLLYRLHVDTGSNPTVVVTSVFCASAFQ